MDYSETEKEAMIETIRAGKGEPRMTVSQESMDQEKDFREHQTDTLAEIDIQETTHKQGTTTEKETTVMKGKEETMRKTGTEHMTETATTQTTIALVPEIEKEGQGTLQEEIGEIRIKLEKNTGLMRRETEKPVTQDMETETTQDTEITLGKETIEDTGMILDQENTEDKGMIQDQRNTQGSETTPDQEIILDLGTTPDKEKTQDQETVQTTTEEETEKTQGISEAKAETETHGRQCLSTRET